MTDKVKEMRFKFVALKRNMQEMQSKVFRAMAHPGVQDDDILKLREICREMLEKYEETANKMVSRFGNRIDTKL